jgi:hypothetical protein
MASTAIPALKSAILAALEADPTPEGLDGVAISGDKEPTRESEYVWLYKAKAKREFKTIGRRPVKVDEDLSISLRVLAVKGSQAEAESRALAIAAAVEGVLRDLEPGDDEAVFLAPLLVQELEDEPLLFDQKAGCHVLMTVVTKARI